MTRSGYVHFRSRNQQESRQPITQSLQAPALKGGARWLVRLFDCSFVLLGTFTRKLSDETARLAPKRINAQLFSFSAFSSMRSVFSRRAAGLFVKLSPHFTSMHFERVLHRELFTFQLQLKKLFRAFLFVCHPLVGSFRQPLTQCGFHVSGVFILLLL